jgi:hypothetical protein
MAKTALDKQIQDVFEPYLMALGRVAHSWNHLQEALGGLFCTVAGLNEAVGLPVWHSSASDRAQRKMLRAVVDVFTKGSGPAFPRQKMI